MKNLRVTVRVEERDGEKIEQLINRGCYRSLSDVLRQALHEFQGVMLYRKRK